MKIKKIYISAFGGLKDFTLELNDGLNVVYGNNEDGKSTVAAFIKAMFFGTGRSTKNLAESPRQKYTPWSGDTPAGRIYFENNNKNYCLEREFKKSDSTDRILLTDLDSGKPIEIGESVGKQFFGVSSAAFERSLFIGNGDFIKDDAAASEINGKLSNIAVTGNEDVSYKKIEKNILSARTKLISKNGKSGSYNEDLQRLDELNARLKKADEDAKEKLRLNEEETVKRVEFEKLNKEYNKLKAMRDSEQDFKNREMLTEFLDTKRSLDKLNETLTLKDGTVINENFAQKIEFCLNKYNTSADRIAQIEQDIESIKANVDLQGKIAPEQAKEKIDDLNGEIEKLNQEKADFEKEETALTAKITDCEQKLNYEQNRKKAFNPVFLILGIVFAAVSGAAAVMSSTVGAVLGVAAAITFFVLAFVIRPKNTSGISNAQSELTVLTTRLADIKAQKNSTVEKTNNINADINKLSSVLQADSAVKQQLSQKTELLQTEQQKAENAKAELLDSVSSLGSIDNTEDVKNILNKLKQKTEQQKELKLKLKTESQFLGNIDYDEAQKKLDSLQDTDALKGIDFVKVKADFDKISEEKSISKDGLTEIETRLKTSFRNSENPEEIRREMLSLKEKSDSKKAFCDAADLATTVLEESFYELRRGYGSELEKLTHNIFAELTDGRYNSVNVSDTLDISVEQTGVFGTRELGFLSLGTTHQAYLSLRLAIAKLISPDNSLPVFLDDSLAQYDDKRCEHAIKFLQKYCLNGQGILFTCHNSICEIAEKSGITVQKPYK